MVIGLLLPIAGCQSPTAGPPPFRNLVVVVIDTLRSDHLPSYGALRPVAPFLSTIANDGVQLQGVAASSWTRTSIATLLTGLHPQRHGTNTGSESLPVDAPYLPQILHEADFATLGYSSNDNSSHAYGFDRGFDHLVDVFPPGGAPPQLSNPLSPLKPDGRLVTQRSLELADQIEGRFLLYVHYLDPHDPYTPTRSWSENLLPEDYVQPADYPSPRSSISEDDLQRLIDQYDGTILQVDRQVERLLTGLEQRGLLTDTLVVVTSDHGEEFLEHGNLTHGKTLHQEVLRVPFLLWATDRRLPVTYATTERFHHIDFLPTMLEALGLHAPDDIDGESRWAALSSGSYREPDEMLHFLDLDGRAALSLIRGSTKAIHQGILRPNYSRDLPTNLIFEHAVDPLEREPLTTTTAEHERLLADLVGHHNRLARHRLRPAEASTTERIRQRLAALGYLAPSGVTLRLPARLQFWDGRRWGLFGHEDPARFSDTIDFQKASQQLLHGWIRARQPAGATSERHAGVVFASRSNARQLVVFGESRAHDTVRVRLRLNGLENEPLKIAPGAFEITRSVPSEALIGPLLYVDFETEPIAESNPRRPIIWRQVQLH